jgi:rhodanese-related sulfurtransferase
MTPFNRALPALGLRIDFRGEATAGGLSKTCDGVIMTNAYDGGTVKDLTPQEVAQGLSEGRMLLVDVREPNEIALERFPNAEHLPLSSFDPKDIPDPRGRQVVFACRSGRRSVTASLAAQSQGLAYGSHMAGGILAWKAAGLPTES